MKRRQFLAGAGAATTGLVGYLGARITNVRHYAPLETVDDALAPGERIFEAARLLHVLDHRAVTRVTVLDDGMTDDAYEVGRYRHQMQPSRRRHLFAYTTFAVANADVPPVAYFGPHTRLHHHEATQDDHDLPLTTVAYFSPGTIVYDPTAETPGSPDEHLRVNDADDRVQRGPGLARTSGDRPELHDYVLTPDVAWERLEETDETASYEITDRDEYAKVPPVSTLAGGVGANSRIAATLNRDTGRLLELDERRVVEQPVDGGADRRWFTYRIETRFDRYGEATARMPDGPVPRPSPRNRLRELWLDLTTY